MFLMIVTDETAAISEPQRGIQIPPEGGHSIRLDSHPRVVIKSAAAYFSNLSLKLDSPCNATPPNAHGEPIAGHYAIGPYHHSLHVSLKVNGKAIRRVFEMPTHLRPSP